MSDLLTTAELAERWRISEATLKRWRADGQGPPYIKLAGQKSILYRLKDIIDMEEKFLVTPKEVGNAN